LRSHGRGATRRLFPGGAGHATTTTARSPLDHRSVARRAAASAIALFALKPGAGVGGYDPSRVVRGAPAEGALRRPDSAPTRPDSKIARF
jgi:hypothetical protein